MKSHKKKSVRTHEERVAALTVLRDLKMARSSHSYVRGNTRKFYEWLATGNGKKVPQGPAVWICGDCHIGNLGPIANSKGKIEVQIRDLDQTIIGNPAHDLIRLGLSLASAARGSDLPGITTVEMLEKMVEGYEQAFGELDEAKKGEQIDRPEAVKIAMKDALRRKWRHLAKERIEDTEPTIPLGKRFWRLTPKEKTEIENLFALEQTRRLVTKLKSRDDNSPVKVLDAAFWVKGCSSLGGLRYAVLIQVGKKRNELCLVDIKEAVPGVAPKYNKKKIPKNHGERVVTGAWHLSPALGERMFATEFQGKPVFLRELLPQDLKFDIETLTQEEAARVSKYLAYVVGKAHARQMDEATRKHWKVTLANHRSKTLDAPSWLWASVVELMQIHEAEYLEHCRKHSQKLLPKAH